MLEVVFYQTNDILIQRLNDERPPLVVCPSPQVADNLRSLAPELDIITISKWVSNHLKRQGASRVRKSELMIKLAAVWRHYYPNDGTSAFLEAFELFTELRSYTLNLDLLGEFLQELEENVRKSIHIFWLYLDQEKIVDEHLSYNKVTESKFNSDMVFVGFKHMSGVQIDMLKTLSEHHNVQVLFPESVYEESLPNDWIRWLSPIDDQKKIKKEMLGNVRVGILPRGKANVVLDQFFHDHPEFDLVMAGTQIGLTGFQEAQRKDSFFKTNEDIFKIELNVVMRELREILKEKRVLAVAELSEYLEAQKIKLINQGEYRRYKIVELLALACNEYSEFQKIIDNFALDILEVIVGLNAPRVSFLSLEEKATRSYLDMNGLNFRDENRKVALMATKSIGGFRANERILSEAMTKALRVIGPIKRAGLDFLFHKYELLSILSDEKNALLIEEEILETDLSWREVLKSFYLKEEDLGVRYFVKPPEEYLKNKKRLGPFEQKNFSASRLQTFIDCPQKYYFSYIDKIDNRPDERSSLGPDELGNLEHKIIAQYFTEKKASNEKILNLEDHRKICARVFNEYLEQSKLSLNETEKSRAFNEIMHYTWNGITFLLDLMKDKIVVSIKFEVPLETNPWSLRGFIDCVIELENKHVIVLDFKRSSGATGTKTETLDLKKVQLWVYLLALKNSHYTINSFGYLNLSDLSDDKLFFDEHETQKVIPLLEKAEAFIVHTISSLKNEKEFLPIPREKKVCSYCSVNLFCLKGESA